MGNKTARHQVQPQNDNKAPLTCTGCDALLKTVDYKIWGTKRFDPKTGSYKEDDSLGNTDMEFSCPNCSAKLDPEAIIGF